jgi:hypothetical protein
VVSELAANATTHSRLPGRDFRLALHTRDNTLRNEVTDTRGDALPSADRPPSTPTPDAASLWAGYATPCVGSNARAMHSPLIVLQRSQSSPRAGAILVPVIAASRCAAGWHQT